MAKKKRQWDRDKVVQREKKGLDWFVVQSCTWLYDVRWVLTAPLVQHSPTWHFNTAYCWSTSSAVRLGACARVPLDSDRDCSGIIPGNFDAHLSDCVSARTCEHVRVDEHLNCWQNLILFLNSKENRVELTHTAGCEREGEDGGVCNCVHARARVCVSVCVYVTATPLWWDLI